MASMTITTTGAQDTRIAAAFGKYLGLPGNANAAQVKAEVIAFIKLTVENQEKQAAVTTATDSAVAALTGFGAVT